MTSARFNANRHHESFWLCRKGHLGRMEQIHGQRTSDYGPYCPKCNNTVTFLDKETESRYRLSGVKGVDGARWDVTLLAHYQMDWGTPPMSEDFQEYRDPKS